MNLIALTLAIFKALLLCLPLAVAYLAFRRLILSTSINGWLYGLAGLLMGFTVGGLTPWAFLQATPQPVLVAFAALSPAIWLLVVSVCGPGKNRPYDEDLEEAEPPLLLTDPIFPNAPVVTFRHAAPQPSADGLAPRPATSVLDAARRMRGRPATRRFDPIPAAETTVTLAFLRS